MEEAPEGTETTQRDGLERREDISGQEGCRVDSLEKSMTGMEGRGCTAETGNGREARAEGQERASATTFWKSGKWTRLLFNSEMEDNCRCCRADQGREILNKD